jgi:hypothetical protein
MILVVMYHDTYENSKDPPFKGRDFAIWSDGNGSVYFTNIVQLHYLNSTTRSNQRIFTL